MKRQSLSTKPSPRSALRDLPPVTHGAFDFAELERLDLPLDAVVDFSVNSNPYGPSPLVSEVISQTPIERYPDRASLALRRALTEALGVEMPRLLTANGVAELLWLVALAYVRPHDDVMILTPTFGEYANVVQLMGGTVTAVSATANKHFKFTRRPIDDSLARAFYRLVFICRPNNPTGQLLPLAWLAEWAERYPETLFVVDEAYIAFVPDVQTAVPLPHPNLLILRSMTKDFALAGLRLGYAVGHKEVIACLSQVQPPWSVNGLAQAAGVAALADQAHLNSSLTQLQANKKRLIAGLTAIGFVPLPSVTHYFLLPVADAATFRQKLLTHGLLVRDCTSFGLPTYVRIATRRDEENGRLLAAMQTIANKEKQPR